MPWAEGGVELIVGCQQLRPACSGLFAADAADAAGDLPCFDQWAMAVVVEDAFVLAAAGAASDGGLPTTAAAAAAVAAAAAAAWASAAAAKQQQQRGSSSSEGIAAARAEQQQQQQLQVAVLEPGVSPDGEEVQKGKKEKNEKTEKEQKEQEEQQPPSKAKRPRLSVTDSIALISSRLDERNASKVAAGSNAKKAAKAAAKAASVFEGGCRPTFSIERSRKRVQCRAGLKGRGQSCSISFASAGGEQQAVAKAQKWVKIHEESVGVRL